MKPLTFSRALSDPPADLMRVIVNTASKLALFCYLLYANDNLVYGITYVFALAYWLLYDRPNPGGA